MYAKLANDETAVDPNSLYAYLVARVELTDCKDKISIMEANKVK